MHVLCSYIGQTILGSVSTIFVMCPMIHINTHISYTSLWRHNGRNGVSNHQPHDCLHKRLFRRRSKKTSRLRVTGLCAGNSPGTGEFPAHMASNAENVSIWWRHHENEWCCISYSIEKRVVHEVFTVFGEAANISTLLTMEFLDRTAFI